MTFSNEPGIYVPGEFGLRCEDDMVVAAESGATSDAEVCGFAEAAIRLMRWRR